MESIAPLRELANLSERLIACVANCCVENQQFATHVRPFSYIRAKMVFVAQDDTLNAPTTRAQMTSAFSRMQKQAHELLVRLGREIRSREADLRRLKKEESQLSAMVGQRGTDGAKPASGGTAGATARINWAIVLEQLPKQFRASQIRSVHRLRSKLPSEIFAAITRWMEAGSVKRKERGLYERVKQAQARRS